MQIIRKLFFVGLCLIFLTGTLNASGFSIFEQGARSMGFAGAFTARVNDLSAIFHNPAGLANLYGTNVQLGTTLINVGGNVLPSFKTNEYYMNRQWFYPSTLYFSSRINDKVTAGFGFNTQYGLGVKWPERWAGEQIITEVNLHTFFLTPTIAYKVNDQLNLGAGITYVIAKVDLANIIPNMMFYPVVGVPLLGGFGNEIEADGSGIGFNIGAQYKVNEMVDLGFSYRHKVKLKAEDGTATFTPDGNTPGILPAEDKVSAELSLPSTFSLGIGYQPTEKIAGELDINYTGWSAYDKLTIEYDGMLGKNETEKNWKNVISVRLGGEYFYDDKLTLRAGAYYDQTPIPDEHLDPILPDADRFGINLGVGYSFEKFTVDFAFLHLFIKERTVDTSKSGVFRGGQMVPFNGTYKMDTNLVGLSFSYKIN
jgi:long-chain fatty acid transport protein